MTLPQPHIGDDAWRDARYTGGRFYSSLCVGNGLAVEKVNNVKDYFSMT